MKEINKPDNSLFMAKLRHVMEVMHKNDFNRMASAKELWITYRGLSFIILELRHYGFHVPDNPQYSKKSQRMTNVIGIDVSKWQGVVDWKKVKSDVAKPQFVYMRGTIGADSLDSKFETYYPQARDVGLKIGMYHLIWPLDDFESEVDHILEHCSKKHFDLPLAIDVEQKHGLKNATLSKYVMDLCLRLEREGQRIVIYTGGWFWNPNINRHVDWKMFDLWTASYTEKPILPLDWQTHRIWQKTSSYRMQGITANTVDVNEFNGNESEFEAWINQKKGHPYADNSTTDNLGG